MDDAERCEMVAEELRRLGYVDAYSEHTGGGIFCVFVPETRFGEGECWIFGMANENWGGGRLDADGMHIESADVETGIPSWVTGHAALREVAKQIDSILRNL